MPRTLRPPPLLAILALGMTTVSPSRAERGQAIRSIVYPPHSMVRVAHPPAVRAGLYIV